MDFNIQKIYNILWHLKCKLLHKNSIKTVWNSKLDLSDFFEVQILIYRCVCWVECMIDRILWKVGQLQTCWSFPVSFHIKALTCKLIHITSCMWTDRLNWKTFTFSVSKSSKYPSSWPEIQRARASKYIFQVGYIDKMNYRTFLCKSYWKELKLLICRRGILKTWGFT